MLISDWLIQKIHSADKPFSCNIDNCTYVTNRRDKLKEHQGRSHKPKEDEAEIKLKIRPSKIIFNNFPSNPDSPEPSPGETVTLNFSQL